MENNNQTQAINLSEKFSMIDDHWSPRIIAQLNGQLVKLAKFKGVLEWHSHENEDEFFHVIKGAIKIHLKDQVIDLQQGECYVVPRGVLHQPEAEEEAEVLMFEPRSTEHTGKDITEQTVSIADQHWI